MSLILYTTIGVTDLERSARFYDAVFATLGYHRSRESDADFVAWGPTYEGGAGFWICKPFDGQPPSVGNGTMVALRGRSEAQVQAFYKAALLHGGKDEGAPGTREAYGPSFYVGYVRDPDGNKLACVFHKHKPKDVAS
ncbi:VOC family protein [Acidisoma cellulosilytica]|uniref:VOC family protein n=1 Tax=Acidisoma cellulosilyticum TaxID=2802395 RepID=A0A963YX34_9PROT|nr:VOC family protein [Acidisoma cellulosilyticum]MCB8878721.1 VOC family protein [Acidisoma cellulosilyticum]